MTNYEIPIPVIKNLPIDSWWATGNAKQVIFGNVYFIYFDITLIRNVPIWRGIVTGMTTFDVEDHSINSNGVLFQVKPKQGFVQSAQDISQGTHVVFNQFYVV